MSKIIKSKKRNLIFFGFLFIFIAIILFTIFFMRGQTVVSGNWEGSEQTDSITCESSTTEYSLFRDNEASNRHMKIRAVFNNDALKTISLAYTLYYDNLEQVIRSEALNHAEMADYFNEDKLGADPLSISYSIQDDKLITTLVGSSNLINSKTAKYFLLSYENNLTKDIVRDNYINQGFACFGDDI